MKPISVFAVTLFALKSIRRINKYEYLLIHDQLQAVEDRYERVGELLSDTPMWSHYQAFHGAFKRGSFYRYYRNSLP